MAFMDTRILNTVNTFFYVKRFTVYTHMISESRVSVSTMRVQIVIKKVVE